jgi:Ulp1 family protease
LIKIQGGRECGVYVVHFTVKRLFGTTFEEFNDEYLPDEEIKKYRKHYWTVVPEYE